MSSSRPRQGLTARAYAAVVVGLRHIIPLAWIAAAVAATVALPGLGDAPAAPLDDLAAKGGSAAKAQELATRTFGFPLATDTAVVQRDPRGLSQDAQHRQLDAALAVRDRRDPALKPLQAAIPLSNARVRTPSGERGTTAVTYLLFAPDTSLDDESSVAQHYAQQTLGGPRAAVVGVTGAAPARQAQFHKIEQALPVIEAASVVLIALIVALAFRSIGAPLVALAAAGIAYTIAMRVLPWLGERADLTVPKEIEPVIVVLLLGLVTDYSIFFLSATRDRLRAGDERLPAARGAIAEVAPIVVTAGLIVAAGTAALVVGHLQFFRAFGPGLAATTLITLAVSVTLVPALVALFGPRLFGASQLREQPPPPPDGDEGSRGWAGGKLPLRLTRPVTAVRRTGELARQHQTPRWRLLVSRVASSRPVALPIALIAIGLLVFAALNVRSTALGLSLVRALPAGDQVRRADDAASRGFAPGSSRPRRSTCSRPASRDARRSWRACRRSSPASRASPRSWARPSSRPRPRRR
jgi:RND superfamily putative drug exporter